MLRSKPEVGVSDSLTVKVNGRDELVPAAPDRPLLEVLREDLKLTGTRYGCGEGECGACGVLVDGRRALSCQMALSQVGDAAITTIEGLADGDTLHPAQRVFLDENAFQCGYCTSGMIVGVVGLVNANPAISDEALLAEMNGNLCRCCGYARIGPALCKAAAAMREGQR